MFDQVGWVSKVEVYRASVSVGNIRSEFHREDKRVIRFEQLRYLN